MNLDDIESMINWDNPVAKENVVKGSQANPDSVAEAQKLGKQFEVPAVVVEQAPDLYKQKAKVQDALAAVEDPKLAQYAENPHAAKVSNDDWGPMKKLGKVLSLFGEANPVFNLSKKALKGDDLGVGTGEDFAKGYSAGTKQAERGALGVEQEALGLNRKEEISQLDKELKELEDRKGVLGLLGDMIGQMTPSGNITAAGAAATAWAGPGAGAGALFAFSADQARRAWGNKLLDLDKVVDSNGKKIDPVAKHLAAAGYGLTVGMVNYVMGGSVANTTVSAVKNLLDEALGTIVKSPNFNATVLRGTMEIGKAGLTGAALMGLQESAGMLGEELAKMATSPDFKTFINDSERRQEIVTSVTQQMAAGFAISAMLHAPGVGANVIIDKMHMKQAELNKQKIDALMKARDEAKTWQRDPDLIKDFADLHGNPDFKVNAETALVLHKDNPGAFSFIPNFEEFASLAAMGDADISIPMGVYLRHITPDVHAQVVDDLKIGDSISINEAKELKENPPKYEDIFHGTPWDFTEFDDTKFGTGEGANTYGQGHYVTEHPGIAEFYKDSVTSIHDDQSWFVGDELADFSKPEHHAAMTVTQFGGDRNKARADLESAAKMMEDEAEKAWKNAKESPTEIGMEAYTKTAQEAEKAAAMYRKAMDLVYDSTLPPYELRSVGNKQLYPQVMSGKLKVLPEEMSDLRKSPKEQNEKTLAALAQMEKEVEALYSGQKPFMQDDNTLKELLSDYERELGKDRVRQIFIENGVKAHKYETTQSMRKGGEVRRKSDQRFMQNEELSKAGIIPTDIEGVKAMLDLEIEKARAANDPALQQLTDERAKYEDFENAPAHNYVVLQGKDIQITHKNGVEVKPLEPPPEVAASPEAAQIFSDAKDITVQAVEAERLANEVTGLFADAKAAGMTNVEYALYLKRLSEMQSEINDKAYAIALKEAKRRLTPEWKENLARIRDEVEDDLRATPEMMALNYLQQGEGPDGGQLFKWKLDKAEVEKILGEYAGNRPDYPRDLPKGVTQKDGMHPDDAADLFGFGSGRELLQKLGELERDRAEAGQTWGEFRKAGIEREAQARMEAQYGRLEENISQVAKEAALSAKQLDILSRELDQLAKLTGIERPFTDEGIRQSAREVIAKQTVENFNSKSWQRAAGKAGRKAEMALLKGKYDAAFRAKQQQMIALHVQKEALRFEKEGKKLDKMLKPFIKENVVGAVSQRFTDQIHQMLANVFGVPIFRDMVELRRGGTKPLAEFVDDLRDEGMQLDIPDFMTDQNWLRQNGGKGIESLSVEEHRDLQDFVKQLIFQGKNEKKLMLGEEKAALEEVVRQVKENGQKLYKQGGIDDKDTFTGRSRHIAQVYDAANLRIERLIQWMDHRDSNGPLNKWVFRPLAAAQNKKLDMATKIARKIKALPDPTNLRARITNNVLRNSEGQLMKLRKENIIVAALNMGTESNWQTFTKGWNVDPDAMTQLITENMTKPDWDFVKGVWKILDEDLFPEADAASRRTTGVGLKKIEPREVVLPTGERFMGGYYPLSEHYDVLNDNMKRTLEGQQVGGFNPLPTRGYTKRRTGMAYPVNLEIAGLSRSVNEMIHDIAFREPVIQARKVLGDFTVRKTIKDAFGEAYVSPLNHWLRRIATNGGLHGQTSVPWVIRGSRFLRENMVMMLIGFRPGTAVIHGGAALSNSLTEMVTHGDMKGGKDFLVAAVDMFTRNPQTGQMLMTEVMNESVAMRNRKHTIDRDVAAVLQLAVKPGKFWQARAAYASWATSLVANLDLGSAIPTYMAAKKYAMERKGMNHEDAIYFAEQMVRNAHGSNGIVDMPAVMAGDVLGGEAAKWITAFGGYFNHNYNQQRDFYRHAAEGTKQVVGGEFKNGFIHHAQFLGGMLGYLLVPALIHTMVRGSHGTKGIDEDPVGWLEHSISAQLLSSHFIVRDANFWFNTGAKDNLEVASPLNETLTGILRVGTDLYSWADKDKMPKDFVKHMLEGPGFAVGVGPSRYLADWAAYGYAWNEGRARDLNTYWDWHRMVLDAKAPKKRRKH